MPSLVNIVLLAVGDVVIPDSSFVWCVWHDETRVISAHVAETEELVCTMENIRVSKLSKCSVQCFDIYLRCEIFFFLSHGAEWNWITYFHESHGRVEQGKLEREWWWLCYVVNEQLISLQSVDISCSIAKARANNGDSLCSAHKEW